MRGWIIFSVAAAMAAEPAAAQTLRGTVTAVRDGGAFTLDAEADGRVEMRVFGIDAPALTQQCRADAIYEPGPSPCVPCGAYAREVLAGLILGKAVTCVDRGKAAGVTLAECTVGKVLVGPSMLTQGQAVADREVLTVKDRALYIGAEASGKRAMAGMWAMTFIPPAAWRAGKRLVCEAMPPGK